MILLDLTGQSYANFETVMVLASKFPTASFNDSVGRGRRLQQQEDKGSG